MYLRNVRLLQHWPLCWGATHNEAVGKTNLPLNESLPHKRQRSVFILFSAVANVDIFIILWVTSAAQGQWVSQPLVLLTWHLPVSVAQRLCLVWEVPQNPLSCNRRQLPVRPLCGPFDSSQQTLYDKCIITINKIPSTQVMYVLSVMLQHVSISEGHLERRRYKIYEYRCADL